LDREESLMKERMRKALGFLGLIEDEYGEYATSAPARPFTDQPGFEEEPEWSPSPVTSSGVRPFPTTASTSGPVRPVTPRPAPVASGGFASAPTQLRPMPSNRIRTLTPQGVDQELTIFFPVDYNDSRRVTDMLRSNRPVVLNVTELASDVARRVVDFTAGTLYALNAAIEPLAKGVYLISPRGTHVGPDTKSRLRESNYRSLGTA
jgi:hypothetical protein